MTSLCSICEQQHQTKSPEVWCPECEEAFCGTCSQHHKIAKATKDHDTIPFDDFQKLPPFILNVNLHCPEHDEKYQHFCRSHDKPICVKCLTTSHKICHDTPVLNDIIKNVKTSFTFEDVGKELKTIHEILMYATKDRRTNLQAFKCQRIQMIKAVESTVDKIINHYQTLKQTMLSEIDKAISTNEEKVEGDLKTLEKQEDNIKEVSDQMVSIKHYTSNLQFFIGIKEMEKFVMAAKRTLWELSNQGSLNDIALSWEENDDIEELVCRVRSFGNIKEQQKERKLSSDTIYTGKVLDAQKKAHINTPYQLKLLQEVEIPRRDVTFSSSITGRCYLPSGEIVICDYGYGYCHLLNQDGSIKSTIAFQKEEVFDVAFVDDESIFVSNPKEKTLSKIGISRFSIKYCLRVRCEVRGITYFDENIIFCVPDIGIKTTNIRDSTGRNVELFFSDTEVGFKSVIVANSDRVVYTCPGIHTVIALNYQKQLIFKYKDEASLKSPYGLSIDRDMNIFVSGYGSNNILLISPDGITSTELLSETDRLKCPRALHFDNSAKQLLVTHDCIRVRRYSVVRDKRI